MFLRREKIEEREYQRNIFESARESNTLVVLPTGLGKTIVSLLLIDYRLEKYKDSKVLFVAPTKPLVNQHLKTFSNLTKLKLGVVSGEVDKGDRRNVYETEQVIFATPQTIENDIDNQLIDLSDFSLLVVDEAHHTVGNYAYVKIASEYKRKARYPLILGLTASPASDKEKINLICRNLGISKVEIRGEDDPDVAPYVKAKVVQEIRLPLTKEILEMMNRLKLLIQEQIASLQNVGLLKGVAMNRINRRTILMLQKSLQKRMFAGNRTFYTIRGIIITSKLLKLYHASNILATQSIESFNNFLEKVIKEGKSKTDKELANSEEFKWLYERSGELLAEGMEHPKVNEIVRILSEQFKPNQKAIIFTQYRDTVDVICKRLDSIKGIKAVKFIGQGKGGLSQKKQIEIIKDFEAGVYNVLVSTSVSEEGISIKGADVAIFYETVPSGIRTIQRRGRVGRFDAGKIFILIAEGTNDEGYYWVSKRKESKMKKIIKEIKENPKILNHETTLEDFV